MMVQGAAHRNIAPESGSAHIECRDEGAVYRHASRQAGSVTGVVCFYYSCISGIIHRIIKAASLVPRSQARFSQWTFVTHNIRFFQTFAAK